jgi:hypothetical protein
VVLVGGSGRSAAADRIGHALPQPPQRLLIRCPRDALPPQSTPELLQGFDTATQITALAHWLRHQSSPASPLAARAFALARPIGLPPAPLNAANFFAMPCASPSGAPLAAPAPGWLPRLLPANGQIVGCRGGAACGLVKATQELFRLQVLRALWVWEFLAGGGPRPCPGAERWRLSELNAQRIRDEIGSVSRPSSGQYGNNPVFSVLLDA